MEGLQIILLVFTLLLAMTSPSTSIPNTAKGEGSDQDVNSCAAPLGMEHGQIPSSRISASSSFDVKSTGPQNARIRTELVGGAWCPRATIQEGVREYLEIDLDGVHRITKTETQGRFGNGMGQEFAKNFQIEYWRDALGKWINYRDHSGKAILEGNSNTYTAVEQDLQPPIIASKIRFIPHSLHPMTVCMRVEAYGCPYTDGLLYYDSPQGYWKNNPDVDLRDLNYDGWMDEDEILRSGLGILTDTLLGQADFKTERKTQGNRWIGWDSGLEPVKIAFQFDGIRKFTSLSVHVNNLVSEGVEIFRSADIYVSVDGQKFSEFPLRWIPRRDFEPEKAHLLTFPLRGRLASLIRIEFFHANHWLLMSEIFYNSEVYTGNLTHDILSLNYQQDEQETLQRNRTVNVSSSTDADAVSDIGVLGLVIGSVGLFILCCLLLASCIFLRTSKGKVVGDMGLGLRPKNLDDTSLADGSDFHQKQETKDICWTNNGDESESFYNELVFRGFHPPYEGVSFSNPSSSANSTSSSNLTRSTVVGSKVSNTNTKMHCQPSFPEYLDMDGGYRYYGHTSTSQPSTPKSERGSSFTTNYLQSAIAPPPPPPKFKRPVPSHYTFNSKALGSTLKSPLCTTSTSGIPHPHGNQHSMYQKSPGKHGASRPTNYYAATDILRRESSTTPKQIQSFQRF